MEKRNATVAETLLRERTDDQQSALDDVHVQRICHVLRANCGEHGARLAAVLVRQVRPSDGDEQGASVAPDEGKVGELEQALAKVAKERDALQAELGTVRSQLAHQQATRGQREPQGDKGEAPASLQELGLR